MRKSVTGIVLVVAAVLLVPVISYAAGLGKLTVRSALGQPLDAEIEIVSLRPGEEDSFQARLASREAFRQAGIDFSPALASARFSIERRGGKSLIRITTTQPVNDPFLNVLVELQWPNGRLAREYTVLVDPIEYKSAQAAAAAREPPQAQAVRAAPAQAAPAPAQTVAAAPLPPPIPVQAAAVAPAPPAAPIQAVAPVPSPAATRSQAPAPGEAAPPLAVPGPAPVPALAAAQAQAPTSVRADAPTPAAAPTPAVATAPASVPAPAPVAAAAAPAPAPVAAAAAPAPAQVAAAAAPQPARAHIVAPAPVPAPSPAVAAAPVPATAPTPAVVATPAQAPAAARSIAVDTAPAPISPTPRAAESARSAAAVDAAAARSVRDRRAADTYRIKRGDTLGAIARKWKPDGLTFNQMLIALYQGNRDVFIRNNINLIRAGAILAIPDRDQVAAIDAGKAFRQVMSQMAEFARYRRHQSATVTAASVSSAPGQREAVSRRVAVRKTARSM